MNAGIVTRAYICVYNKPDDSKSMHIYIYPYIHTVQSTNYVHIEACINVYILSYTRFAEAFYLRDKWLFHWSVDRDVHSNDPICLVDS